MIRDETVPGEWADDHRGPGHLQRDVDGERFDSVYLCDEYGRPIYHDTWIDLCRIVEWEAITGELLGDFPQACTHLALSSAAYDLDRRLGGAG